MKLKLIIAAFVLLFLRAEAQQYGYWEIIDSMNIRRWNFSTSIFSNNKILAAGSDGSPILNSAEIYNLDNNTWANTTSMLEGRAFHHLITLNNNEVIAIGGFLLKSCEIFNPASNSWRYIDSLETLKYFWDTATLLNDGIILVAGGYYFDQSTLQNIHYKMSEIFDPITETWSFADSLEEGRSGHTATLLNDGRVLVTGGQGNVSDLNSCEIFDPITIQWSSISNLLHSRSFHSAVLLSDGKVFVSGGVTPDSTLGTRYCEIYDPITDSWSEAGEMTVPRTNHKTLLLLDSTVLITGGTFEPEVWEIYDPKTLSIIYFDALPIVVFEPELEQFPDGRIISLGGYTFDGMVRANSNQCFIYTARVTSVTEERSLVTDYSLSQNHPNPFNPSTTIKYTIKENGYVSLKVYDILGREVIDLISEKKSAGSYNVTFNADGLVSGVYIYKLKVNDFIKTKKMILTK